MVEPFVFKKNQGFIHFGLAGLYKSLSSILYLKDYHFLVLRGAPPAAAAVRADAGGTTAVGGFTGRADNFEGRAEADFLAAAAGAGAGATGDAGGATNAGRGRGICSPFRRAEEIVLRWRTGGTAGGAAAAGAERATTCIERAERADRAEVFSLNRGEL